MSVRPEEADAVSKGGRPWWLAPAIAAATTVGGSILQYKLSKKNTDSAHQREVADLGKAGLNPLLSVMGGRGSADPVSPDFGEGVSRGVVNALSVAQLRANLDLTRASADKTRAEATTLGEEATNASTMAQLKLRYQGALTDFAELNAIQKQRTLDSAVQLAKNEVARSAAGARSLKARAELDELARIGARNMADFEKRLGEGSPAALLLLKALSTVLK